MKWLLWDQEEETILRTLVDIFPFTEFPETLQGLTTNTTMHLIGKPPGVKLQRGENTFLTQGFGQTVTLSWDYLLI
jgi:hypothetical protein